MAIINVLNSDEIIDLPNEVARFLRQQNIIYEHWDIGKLPVNLRETFDLDDEEKQSILHAFQPDIIDLSLRRGYKEADVISLSDKTPNIDELLANFEQQHHHTDDEVRFIVSGHGVFFIEREDIQFKVLLDPGDLVAVPANVKHYFTLADDRKVVAIRIFITPEGWIPIYDH